MKPKWQTLPLGEFIKLRKEPIIIRDEKVYRRVTTRLHGRGVELRDEIQGSEIKTKKQFPLKKQDLLVAEIDAKVGGYGIVPDALAGAVVSSHYFTYEVDQSRLNIPFLSHWLRSPHPLGQIQNFIRGALNYAAIRPYHFPRLQISLPDLPEQERLAARLDALSARLAEARRLHDELADEQQEFLLSLAREIASGAPREPMEQVAPLCRRPVVTRKREQYPEIAVRSFGRGTFHKPTLKGSELTWQKLYRVKAGDLLFSNIKAWEGAVAVVQPEDDGRVGSHRYLTCVPNPSKATADFLCQWFLTDDGLREMGGASRGATDRNRTLGMSKLTRIPVPVPPLPKQKEFAALRCQIQSARALHATLPEELAALQSALLDRAFKGEL